MQPLLPTPASTHQEAHIITQACAKWECLSHRVVQLTLYSTPYVKSQVQYGKQLGLIYTSAD